MWHVYILLCEDKSFYTGITNNLEKRFLVHVNGKGGNYTRSHKPLKIIYTQECFTHQEALKREFEIKGWSKYKKIKNLKLEGIFCEK